MWDQVLTSFKGTLDKAESTYLAKAKSKHHLFLFSCFIRSNPHSYIFSKGFNCTDEENTSALATLRKRAWLALRAKVDEQTADAVILGKLRGHFEERFRYDENGVPRVWKPDDDIDGAFKKAKDQVRSIILWLGGEPDLMPFPDTGTYSPLLKNITNRFVSRVYPPIRFPNPLFYRRRL